MKTLLILCLTAFALTYVFATKCDDDCAKGCDEEDKICQDLGDPDKCDKAKCAEACEHTCHCYDECEPKCTEARTTCNGDSTEAAVLLECGVKYVTCENECLAKCESGEVKDDLGAVKSKLGALVGGAGGAGGGK